MRGVGQTTNLIYTLPNERCMVVTPNHGIARMIEGSIKEVRGKNFAKSVKVISVSSRDDLVKVRGYSHLIFFDHSFFDLVEEAIAKEALETAKGAAIVYHTHKGNFQ